METNRLGRRNHWKVSSRSVSLEEKKTGKPERGFTTIPVFARRHPHARLRFGSTVRLEKI